MNELILTSARLTLRSAAVTDAAALCAYRQRNRAALQPWEPLREESYYSTAATYQQLAQRQADRQAGRALPLLLSLQADPDTVIGECHFSNIVRGPFQACHLGFSLDQDQQGQGLMREALSVAIAHVFGELQLHRVMANYQPHNLRSARLLAALGFRQEGLAPDYLKINGRWADHVLTSLLAPADGQAA